VCFDNTETVKNNDVMKIVAFTEKTVKVQRGQKELDLDRQLFTKKAGPDKYLFDYHWAATVNRVQGLTLRDRYNVWECTRMPLGHFYTALSRTVDYKNVAVGTGGRGYTWPARECTRQKSVDPKQASCRGVIYRLYDDNGKWYVGKTEVRRKETYSSAAERRFEEHKQVATSEKMRLWLQSKAEIKVEVVKSGYFLTDYQLSQFEALTISLTAITHNTECMNTVGVANAAELAAVATKVTTLEPVKDVVQEATAAAAETKADTNKLHELVESGAIKIDTKRRRYRVNYVESGKTKRKEFFYNESNSTAVGMVAVDFYLTRMQVGG